MIGYIVAANKVCELEFVDCELYSIQPYVINFDHYLWQVWWFSSGTFEYSTNVTDCHNITEILLKMAWSNSEIVYMYLIFLHQ